MPGLLPENVTIIDSDSGRVLAGTDSQSPTSDATGLADGHRRNIERLLNARVGPGNAVVEVSVELINAYETVFERRIDPDSRVIIGTESEEMTNRSSENGSGAVTVASNLPEGDAAGGEGGRSTLQNSETRESVTYDVSEIQRETESGPGTIRRISVAVLVNAVSAPNADGILETAPRDAAELASLQALVRSAIGYDEARGDVVTIESMAFEPVPNQLPDDVAGAGIFARFDLMNALQLLVLAIVALAVAFGVIRPLFAQQPRGEGGPDSPPGTLAGPAPALGVAAPPDSITAPRAALAAPAQEQVANAPAREAPPLENAPALVTEEPADPVARLRRLIEEREEETVEILRSWMAEDEEAT